MKYPRVHPRRLGALLGLLAWITLSLFPGQSTPVAAQGGVDAITVAIPTVSAHDLRVDVRHLPPVPSQRKIELELHEPQDSKQALSAQAPATGNTTLASAPAASQSFDGLSYNGSCTGGQCGAGIPPDTNGDVGPNHYIQAVNSSFGIYSKSGTLLASFTENSLWLGSNAGPCDGHGQGDPVVLYDSQADRWILTNFAFSTDLLGNPKAPFYQCFAVSKSGDPVSGGWWLYGLRTDTGASGQPPVGTLNDYPKFGIWNTCLFYSANGFNASNGNYVGGEFGSFSLADMYSHTGLSGALGFKSSLNDYFTMIPGNLSAPGSARPAAGTPDYYVQESLNTFAFKVRTLAPGTNCGPGTLSTSVDVGQASYSSFANNIVPQPNTSTTLASLGDRMMQKVQYRKVGSVESLWVTHTFGSSSGPTGLQWAQINVTGGVIATTPMQQQLYDPGDGIYRWMGSIAADKSGNAAVVYSSSGASGSNFPSIAYAGRLTTDPLSTLAQGETKLVAGSGSQTNSCGGPCHRWGDYSSISVDPANGCTFWFTSEYYTSQSAGNVGAWNTRIGSFKFPSCGLTRKTFTSQAVYDGSVIESGQNTGVGGSLSSTAVTFSLGDSAANRQYRAVLSFGTGALPNNAVIKSVVLKIRQAALAGSNPFNTLGNISVDIRKGAFSNNLALQSIDFQATADQNAAITITNNPSSGWYSGSLNPSYFSWINLAGPTQFRLEFSLASNNNNVADTLKFYSGEYATTTLRPTLLVQYTVP